jgi:hypothetical protein
LLESKGPQVVSAEMTMRLVFLGLLAALLLVGYSMGKDSYGAPQRRRQSTAPAGDARVVNATRSAVNDVPLPTAFADQPGGGGAESSDEMYSLYR